MSLNWLWKKMKGEHREDNTLAVEVTERHKCDQALPRQQPQQRKSLQHPEHPLYGEIFTHREHRNGK